MVLKSSKASIWLRNIQLSVIGLIMSLVSKYCTVWYECTCVCVCVCMYKSIVQYMAIGVPFMYSHHTLNSLRRYFLFASSISYILLLITSTFLFFIFHFLICPSFYFFISRFFFLFFRRHVMLEIWMSY